MGGRTCRALALFLLSLAFVSSQSSLAARAAPALGSPGAADRFAPAAACPTFTWAAQAGSGHLLVYAVEPGGSHAAGAPVLQRALAPGLSAWTPPSDRCLSPGRYAWSLRTPGPEGDPVLSRALLFEISELPSELEYRQALDVVRRYIAANPVAAEEASANGARTSDTPRARSSPAGSAPASEGPVAPVALSESGIDRASASPQTFNVRNTGGGGMTLQVDGNPAFHAGNDGTGSGLDADLLDGNDAGDFAGAAHTHSGGDITSGTVTEPRVDAALARDAEVFGIVSANDGSGSGLDADLLDGNDASAFVAAGTDNWVDETGDAMTGPLNIDVASGFALDTDDSINVGVAGIHLDGVLHTHQTGGLVTNLGVGWGTLGAMSPAAGAATHNTAVGGRALHLNSTGSGNTALGYVALYSNVAGSHNVAVGVSALKDNTASGNVAVGTRALRLNTTGAGLTAVGYHALDSNSNGYYNTAVGWSALTSNTTASHNTGLGYGALKNTTGGGDNVAIGSQALLQNVSGGDNTALGGSALKSNTDGQENTAVGSNALLNTTSGDFNTAIGSDALRLTTNFGNTAVGRRALNNNVAGGYNVAVGHGAGTNTTGNLNILIGNAGVAAEDNTIRIGTTGLQTRTFIRGIRGVTPGGANNAAVFISDNAQLAAASCGTTYLAAGGCPGGIPSGSNGPRCDRVAPGSFCEGDGECGTDDALNNCGIAEWYLRTD